MKAYLTRKLAARPSRLHRRAAGAAAVLLMSLALTGCMYPRDRMAQSDMPSMDAVASVQRVVELFQKKTGLLPIKNSSQDAPRYEKFAIDFAKLLRGNYISDLPAASFEKGGSYYFLIQNEERDPVVKLMPLVVVQAVTDIQGWVDEYSRSRGGKLPSLEQAYPGYSRIDFKGLGRREPKIRSVFSGGVLPFMMSDKGKVYADYGSDLMRAAQKRGIDSLTYNQDLRALLVEDTDFVPVKSPPYRLQNGEPVPQPE